MTIWVTCLTNSWRETPSIRWLGARSAAACSRVSPTVKCLAEISKAQRGNQEMLDLRKVFVNLLVVNNLTLELAHHLLLEDAVVMNRRLLVDLKTVHFTSHSFQ